ncbi:MAG TPA: serine/threonine-protein kinase, partial [Candidatus Limnocylindria bacterium]|nr:serine/threonine-protein kinase [Candidatus Limnocylindria bacterium]
LGRYRLTDRLATGGSAEVWRAHDEQLQRDVAVKLLHPHLLPDERSRARLASEARAVAGLAHPGIVGVYDVDTDGEAPAVVLELVDGDSLAARLAAAGPLEPREAARIGAEVGEALYHAHGRGVVHRDVKPGNILLERDGRARLVDFGIARTLDEAAERLTVTGTVMGTLRYMAPEQLSGGEIGPRTDLWGLGAVLHEMLTGRPPFDATTPVGLAEAQRSGVPELPGVDPPLARIVVACLAVDPAQRPRHVGSVAAALRSWLAGEPVDALLAPAGMADTDAITAAAIPVAPPDAPVAPAAAAAAARPRAPVARRDGPSWWLIVALLVAVALVALAAFNGARLPGVPGASPSGTPATATPTATGTPTPEPTLDLASLPKPVRDEVEKYQEACGADAPLPPDLASMNKRQAEAYFEPLTEACEGD